MKHWTEYAYNDREWGDTITFTIESYDKLLVFITQEANEQFSVAPEQIVLEGEGKTAKREMTGRYFYSTPKGSKYFQQMVA
jgi:hypothetical protein